MSNAKVQVAAGGAVRIGAGDAGMDLCVKEDVVLRGAGLIGTGVRVAIPEGFVGLVFERSSTHKIGVSLQNKVGVIDPSYRGEIKLALRVNELLGGHIKLAAGTRLAQLVVIPCVMPTEFVFVGGEDLDTTERGDGGFGSTGTGVEEAAGVGAAGDL